jgi:superfamily II DNA or RNA helicase
MARRRAPIEAFNESPETFSPQHLNAARSLFTPRIRQRGKTYFEDLRVLFDQNSPLGAEFEVEGSGGRYYKVSLIVDGTDLSGSSCNCPYQDYCKHIWAALLEAVEEALPLRSLESDLSFPDSPAAPVRDSWVSSRLLVPVPQTSGKVKQYRLIFLIGAFGIHFRNPEFYVRPALRYIKANGELGAISDFRESAVLNDIQALEQMLLDACLKYEGNRLNLYTALGYFQGKHALQAYTDNPDPGRPIRIFQPDGIEVDFEPELQSNEIVFRPLIILKSRDENDYCLIPEECVLDLQGVEKILYHRPSGTLALIKLTNYRENRVLELLVSSIRGWLPSDIQELLDLMPGEDIKHAEISTNVRIIESQPKIKLDIHNVEDAIVIRFHFDESELQDTMPIRHDDGYWQIARIDYQTAMGTARQIAENLNGTPESTDSIRLETSLVDFLMQQAPNLLDMGLELRLGRNRVRIRRPTEFRIESSSGIDWLELRVSIDQQEQNLRNLDPASPLLFTGTDYILLNDEQLEKMILMEGIPRDPSGHARIHPDDIGSVESLGSLANEIDDSRLERSRAIIAKLKTGFNHEEKPVSPLLMTELRDYQKTGLEWLRFLKTFGLGGILADDMGLGKTVQTIALLADALEKGEKAPYLVVAPLSTIPNWSSEFTRFLPGMHVRVHIGIGREKLGTSPDGVVLTTYQILQRDIEDFASIRWNLLCIDESQNIKNSATKSFKAVRRLSADLKLALSGTPIENSVMELWSVMEIVNSGLLGPRDRFKRRYLKASADGVEKRMAELRRRVAPFILRRTKDVVADDLPPKEEIVRTVELSVSQRRFYNRLKNELREQVRQIITENRSGLSAANAVLTALLRLRQAAISPALLGEKPETSSKLDEVLYLLDTVLAEGHKVLIFSQFVKVLKILGNRLEENGIEYAYLDGSLSSRAREAAIQSFRENMDVFLISLKAGGTGLNLTEADYVFILDPWWNPAVETQAIDRSHRIGQNRPVIAYKFIAADTVEERIIELQENKRRIAEDILGFDSSIVSRMDPEEILKLFN